MIPQFIHLHIHTEFSLIDSLLPIKALVSRAVNYKMPAIAVTDQNNLFAAVKFYKAATSAGIKPIFGCDVTITNISEKTSSSLVTLLCQNEQGYSNLICLISEAYRRGQSSGQVSIDAQWLTDKTTQGLIILVGGVVSELATLITDKKDMLHDDSYVESYIEYWKRLFPERMYLVAQRIGKENEAKYNTALVETAERYQLPIVATNAVRFVAQTDYEAHEARVCVQRGETLADPQRKRDYTSQQYLRSQVEMARLFADMPEALENTVEIAKRCNVHLNFGEDHLPNFPIPAGQTAADYLCAKATQCLSEKLPLLYESSDENYEEICQRYQARLKFELDVINTMGFPGYFLIVADFIEWAKQQKIPVGPGRGSGAGSLVAYVLQITNLDPLEYDLLFERFLNPERVSMPDFDIDFCMEGRDRVIDYVADKYGHESVSQIITFGTMAAKAAIRDVGRVLGFPYGFVDKVAKLIPFELGITLEKSLAQEELLRQRYHQEDDVKRLIDLALKLEGITRNAGKHAGGVVIAPTKLTDFLPLYCEPGGDSVVTQFDKDDVEAIGIVKFDFLGLRTLTIIDWALQTINAVRQRQGEAAINIDTIPLDDQATFDLLKSCQTTAVFQLESRGMKDLIKRLQPDKFEEIIALVALFRPGPLQSGMVDDFINRKHGLARVEYSHPTLEQILKSTYGVILYQEQVMQIAQELAGYTLGAADLLRRAMGKKKPEEMAKQRIQFVEGATKNDIERDTANYIFDLMEKFAGYGFNKSHSAAYALLSYQTAWLKAHYPSEFMAAVLSSDMDNTDKVVLFINDCKKIGVKVLPPTVNEGFYKFTVNDNNEVIYGLGAIKGVGEAAIEEVIAVRQVKLFTDLFDFCRRCCGNQKINKRLFEAFISSGAMDCLGAHRASLFASLPRAAKMAEQFAHDKKVGQMDLFAEYEKEHQEEAECLMPCEYLQVPEYTMQEQLAGEKRSLGYYLSGHPLDRYRDELQPLVSSSLAELDPIRQSSAVISGLVLSVRKLTTKRGDPMAIVNLDDGTSTIDAVVFSECLNQYRDFIVSDQLLVLHGEVGVDNFSGGVRFTVNKLWDIETARNVFAKYLQIKLEVGQHDIQSLVQSLQEILAKHKGKIPVVVDYFNGQASAQFNLGSAWQVHLDEEFISGLERLDWIKCVQIKYAQEVAMVAGLG